MNEYSIETLLAESPFFSTMPNADIAAIAKNASILRYKKKSHLYHQNDEAYWLFLITRGWVRLYRTDADGNESAAEVMTQGQLFGERVILEGDRKHRFSAQAIEDTSVIEINGAILRDRLETNPAALKLITGNLLKKMNKLHVMNEQAVLMNGPQRVACFLLRMSAHMVGKGGTMSLPYEKTIAAMQLGMQRETFSRCLSKLQDIGVHCDGSEVRIENFAALSAYCCTQCSLDKTECSGRRIDTTAIAPEFKWKKKTLRACEPIQLRLKFLSGVEEADSPTSSPAD